MVLMSLRTELIGPLIGRSERLRRLYIVCQVHLSKKQYFVMTSAVFFLNIVKPYFLAQRFLKKHPAQEVPLPYLLSGIHVVRESF